jgi:signal transduction histidine kinase
MMKSKVVRTKRVPDPAGSTPESSYRLVFDLHPQPMWVCDADTFEILAANDAATRAYGYSRCEFLELGFNDLVNEPAAIAGSEPAAADQRFTAAKHRTKDGAPIALRLVCRNLKFSGRPAVLVIGEVNSEGHSPRAAEGEATSANAELEQRVRERTAQLEALNNELRAFAFSVSHDLRAPLRSIRGFSEVLLERYAGSLDARGQEYLRRTCEASQHMSRLIEDLLKLSRASGGELHPKPVDLRALGESIIAELRKAEPERSIDIVIAPRLEASGDERLLRILMENLLSNAWKFTRKQSQPRIEIGRTEQPEPAFYVRDNGAGFDMQYAGKLFGVFQRLHMAGEFPGTGVGLATVQRIVNRHGGRVWAQAAVNEGATFYFTLPANDGSDLGPRVVIG